MINGTIGINPGEPTIKLELTITEAKAFIEALNLAADHLDSTLPECDRDIGWDDLAEPIKKQVRAVMILGGCASLIDIQLSRKS